MLPASRACLALKLRPSSVDTYISGRHISLQTRLLASCAQKGIADFLSSNTMQAAGITMTCPYIGAHPLGIWVQGSRRNIQRPAQHQTWFLAGPQWHAHACYPAVTARNVRGSVCHSSLRLSAAVLLEEGLCLSSPHLSAVAPLQTQVTLFMLCRWLPCRPQCLMGCLAVRRLCCT